MTSLLAQTDLDVVKLLLTGGGGAGIAGVLAFLFYRALLESYKGHIERAWAAKATSDESHSKHLEKEAALAEALVALTIAVNGLKEEVKDMRIEHERGARSRRSLKVGGTDT